MEPISTATSSTSVSRLGRARNFLNTGDVGQNFKFNGARVNFYFTVEAGPVLISQPEECCRPPVPGDLYFHQIPVLKRGLDGSQVFFFCADNTWEDITKPYFTWDREVIRHPIHQDYALNCKDDFEPSYVKKETWCAYQKGRGFGRRR